MQAITHFHTMWGSAWNLPFPDFPAFRLPCARGPGSPLLGGSSMGTAAPRVWRTTAAQPTHSATGTDSPAIRPAGQRARTPAARRRRHWRYPGMKENSLRPRHADRMASAAETLLALRLPAAEPPLAPIPAAPAEPSQALVATEEDATALQELRHAAGTSDQALALLWLSQAVGALPSGKDEPASALLPQILPALAGIAPRDELEGMLAVQLVSLHNVAMDHLHRAALPNQAPERRDKYVNNATRLTRAFSQQLEALQRYRGKGQQKVTVEHVHVHSGGQAIVGVVEAGGGRGDRG